MKTKKVSGSDRELWAAIDAQCLRVADLLDTLTDEEWDEPSLCEGWTVRDVAAHLTYQRMNFKDSIAQLLRHPGGMNSSIRAAAIRKAKVEPPETFAREIREGVGTNKHNFGVTPMETHVDIIVHGYDIALPLGRTIDVPLDEAKRAAQRAWGYQGKMKGKVFRDLGVGEMRLVATDVDWQVGTGPEVRGPISALLLLLTGRTAMLDQLSGPGAELLKADEEPLAASGSS